MTNAMMTIHPYKDGVWMFDDQAHGLIREPFILGMSEIIDEFVKSRPDLEDAESGFDLIFSARSFPGFDAQLRLLNSEHGGNWYRWDERNMDGWLCPALFAYFVAPPAAIYVKAAVPISNSSGSR